MAGATPPKIDDSPKSFIGVGTRELVICAVGLILAVMICTTEMNSLLKVGLAVIVAGLAIGLAFGRDPKTGRKIESMLVETLKFHGRDKFHQKGASHVEVYAHPKEDLKKEKEKPKPKPQKEPKEFFKVKAIPLGATFVFNLCSTAFLAVFIAYVFGGGLNAEIFRYNANGNPGLLSGLFGGLTK